MTASVCLLALSHLSTRQTWSSCSFTCAPDEMSSTSISAFAPDAAAATGCTLPGSEHRLGSALLSSSWRAQLRCPNSAHAASADMRTSRSRSKSLHSCWFSRTASALATGGREVTRSSHSVRCSNSLGSRRQLSLKCRMARETFKHASTCAPRARRKATHGALPARQLTLRHQVQSYSVSTAVTVAEHHKTSCASGCPLGCSKS